MIRGHGEIARHVERVVDVVERGGIRSPRPVHDRLARSWERSLSNYRVDPGQASLPQVVTARELREHRERLDTFMRIAREGVDRLYDSLRPAKYCVLLTDAAGVTVDLRTVPELEREFRAEGFRDGTRWSESEEGTCGVGTSLVDRQPILVHRDEHFRSHNIAFTCSSAPIFGIDDEPLAVLDASALNSPEQRDSQALVFQMVVEKARLIEDAFAFHSLRSYWVLQLGRSPELMHVHTDYLVAFDDGGRIVGGNRRARQELLQRRGPAPEYIGDLFECSAADLLSASHARPGQAIPLRIQGTGARIFGLLRAPDARPRTAPAHPAVSGSEAASAAEARGFGHLATDDPRVRNNVQRALKVANRDIPVMLLGETGTGKEAFAKAIHDASDRHKQPFVALNCAAIPESLIESELFGYRDGAFTGARSKGARGKIIQSDGGTLFLDEIGDMPLVLQSRLLRVLAEGEVLPLGAEQPTPVRLHIVCATHQDLPRLVAEGRFREDLYYRLNGAVFLLPPLREREDIGAVIDRVLHEEAQAMSRELRLADETRDALMRHPWPGNIRQLRHAMRYACAISDGPLLMPQSFPPDLFSAAPVALRHSAMPQHELAPPPLALPEAVAPLALKPKDLALRERMLETLRRNQWQVTVSARELGLSRATFYRKLAKLQIVAPNRQAW